MNSLKKQLVLAFLLFGTLGFSQGMMVHSGGTSMKNGLQGLTPEGSAHTGYHIGADGRLGDDDFYFMIGLQYHKLNFEPTEKFTFAPVDPNFQILKGKGGFAFKLFQVNKNIVTRLRVLGSIDYMLNVPDLDTAIDKTVELPDKEFNEAVAGVGGGLEVDVYFLTFNLEYQKGFFKAIKQTDDSSFDFLTFSLGFNF